MFMTVNRDDGEDARRYGVKPVTAKEAARKVREYLRENFDLHGDFEVVPRYTGNLVGHDIVRTAEGDGFIDGDLELMLNVVPRHRVHARYSAVLPISVRQGRVHRPSVIQPDGYQPLLCGQAAFDALARADVGEDAWKRNTRSAALQARMAAYPETEDMGGWLDASEEAGDAREATGTDGAVTVTIQLLDGEGRPMGVAQTFLRKAPTVGRFTSGAAEALNEALDAVEIDASDPSVSFVSDRGFAQIHIETGPHTEGPGSVSLPFNAGSFAGNTVLGSARVIIQFLGAPFGQAELEDIYDAVLLPVLHGDGLALRHVASQSGTLSATEYARHLDRIGAHVNVEPYLGTRGVTVAMTARGRVDIQAPRSTFSRTAGHFRDTGRALGRVRRACYERGLARWRRRTAANAENFMDEWYKSREPLSVDGTANHLLSMYSDAIRLGQSDHETWEEIKASLVRQAHKYFIDNAYYRLDMYGKHKGMQDKVADLAEAFAAEVAALVLPELELYLQERQTSQDAASAR